MSDDKPPSVNTQQAIYQEQEKVPVAREERDKDKAARDYQKTKPKAATMRVKVHSPFREYFDGDVFSITAENTTGQFDVLPRHHNFITLLSPCNLVLRTVNNDNKTTIKISGGIMHVKADRIIIFLDI